MQKAAKREPAFQDTDPMPFGMHRDKPLQDVPAQYLHYIWSDGLCAFSGNLTPTEASSPVLDLRKIKLANYIWNSKDDIVKETGEQL